MSILAKENKIDENQRQELGLFLKAQVNQYQENLQNGESIAYGIAGLLSTESIHALPEDDILVQIMTLAGELELPTRHRSTDATWQKLSEMINQL